MGNTEWTRIESLFNTLIQRSQGERDAFFERAGADAQAMRTEIESLIAADRTGSSWLDRPASLDGISSRPCPVGQSLGAYRLVREISGGPYATVYEAVREDRHYQDKVAVKVAHFVQASGDLARRFSTERQLLASLRHPAIAQILDAGSTPEGRPYFVMELIQGAPIDRYCTQNRLDVEERIRLFLQVCRALQYAHQNLVVHRDIKPSNILVDEHGNPKLLDFGIAKILEPDSFPEDPIRTRAGVRPMTPFYASPEQVRGGKINTSTDVYSLGLLLYEMLTGNFPYDFGDGAPEQVRRAILDQPPKKASLNLAAPAGGPEGGRPEGSLVHQRRRIAGDLDTILQVALRKEPEQRYASVEQMAEDIRRHLEGLPVAARDQSRFYRARKFLRRHRLPISAATFVFLVVGGAAIALGIQASRISEQSERIRRERDRALLASNFLQEIYRQTDPNRSAGREVKAVDLLQSAAAKISQSLKGDAQMEAAQLDAVSTAYIELGLFDEAEPLVARALAVREDDPGPSPLGLAQTLENRGHIARARGAFAEARARYLRSYEIRTEALGADHPLVVESLLNLGVEANEEGLYDEAESYFRRALGIARETWGEEHPKTAGALHNLASLLHDRGNFSQALPFLERSLEFKLKSHGRLHTRVASSLNTLAAVHANLGNWPEAEAYWKEAVAIFERLLGDEHPETLISQANFALFLDNRGRHGQAEPRHRRVLATVRRVMGENPGIAHAYDNLGYNLFKQGRFQEAEPLFLESLRIRRQGLAPDHWQVGHSRFLLGRCLLAMGRLSEAESSLLEAYSLKQKAKRPGGEQVAILQKLVEVYRGLDRPQRVAHFETLSSRLHEQPLAGAK